MSKSEQYRRDHLVAKVIICALYMLVGAVSIEVDSPYLTLLVGTPIWLFGINTTGYALESIARRAHQHRVL